MLPLPPLLVGGNADAAGVHDGLRLTGHFLERDVLAGRERDLLAARERLASRLPPR